MQKIDVKVANKKAGELSFEKENNRYVFNYTQKSSPISLIMPYRVSSYIWKNRLHPIFDMNMPEGYLFEMLKQFISKEYGYIDDFLSFSYLCPNIQSRLTYESWCAKSDVVSFNLTDILHNDTKDTFSKLVHTYLSKNAISGVQPKSLALLKDKESLSTKEYIIKTWGEEYEQLALNEYFCLKAIEKAGVKIANIQLSDNNRFLVVERFNYDKKRDEFLGFEEILTLLGKNKEEKYNGSYESVAKTIYSVTTNKQESMKSFYTVVVMNYLLKNGDAHLKNFGILYTNDFKNIYFSPAYDVVTTMVYYHKDRPALTMFGKKLWFGKKELLKFGMQECYLSKKETETIYVKCMESLKNTIKEMENYLQKNSEFQNIGSKMLDIFRLSLDEKTYKELPDELVRNWN
ncbi:type II toxin-antitoxin system HipA family toxin [Sulfurimonas sp.]|uniref:type II toxin-antitoxin system HipA family toxin n=1 Tax=Sulfurimonas sp. TaxID=2022749 RepID=UPI00261CD7D6|nr:type II toxin-antitoxin system HipA family toxin [Sulfurimonas sp.]